MRLNTDNKVIYDQIIINIIKEGKHGELKINIIKEGKHGELKINIINPFITDHAPYWAIIANMMRNFEIFLTVLFVQVPTSNLVHICSDCTHGIVYFGYRLGTGAKYCTRDSS